MINSRILNFSPYVPKPGVKSVSNQYSWVLGGSEEKKKKKKEEEREGEKEMK